MTVQQLIEQLFKLNLDKQVAFKCGFLPAGYGNHIYHIEQTKAGKYIIEISESNLDWHPDD